MPVYVGVTPVGTVGDAYSASPDGPIQRPAGTGTELFDVLTNDPASGPKTLLSVTAVSPLTPSQVAISGGQVQLTKTGLGAGTYFVDYLGALASNTAAQGAARLTITLTSATATYTANPDGPVTSPVGSGVVDVPVLPNDTTVPAGVAKVILDVAAVAPLTDARLNIVGDVVRVTKTGLAAGNYAFDYTGAQDANRAVRGTGRGTLTLNSGGGSDPLGIIRIYPMDIDSPGGRTVVTPTIQVNGKNEFRLASNTIYNLRGQTGTPHQTPSSDVTVDINSFGDNCTITRFRAICSNSFYDTATWSICHGSSGAKIGGDNSSGNYAAIRVEGTGDNLRIQGFQTAFGMDCISQQTDPGTRNVTYTNGRMHRARDDNTQNDGQVTATWENIYASGHVIVSDRPGTNPTTGQRAPYRQHRFIARNCIFHSIRQPYATDEPDDKGSDSGFQTRGSILGAKRVGPYNGPGDANQAVVSGNNRGYAHKWPFKTVGRSGNLFYCNCDLKDVLFRIDTVPVEGLTNPGEFPPTTGGSSAADRSTYDNVHVLWFGGHPWPFPQSKATLAGMGITLHDPYASGATETEAQVRDLWVQTVAAFDSENGYNGTSYAWSR